MTEPRKSGALNALGLSLAYGAWLLWTAPKLGYARDEGFYFRAADSYAGWFERLFQNPADALTRIAVDAHFSANPEHPGLMKSLFALSRLWLCDRWHLVSLSGTAYRIPGMLMGMLAVFLIVIWGTHALSRRSGLIAGLLFIGLPRVFHHAHLACFDVPVTAVGLLCTYAWWRAVETRRFGVALAAGLAWGLMLDTKHNAWLMPPAFALHLLLVEGRALWAASWSERIRLLRPWWMLLLIGPIVLVALWPWLWFDTFERLKFWVQFHLGHEYYNMEFLGRTYHRPPMPLGYAWLMTLGTVPLTTLALMVVGVVVTIRRIFAWASKPGVEALRAPNRPVSVRPQDGFAHAVAVLQRERVNIELLWLLAMLLAYAPWLSPNTPIFGGTKHWMPAYPYLCLFAGLGFERLVERLRALTLEFPRLSRQLGWAVPLCVVAAPLVITWDSFPFGLSAYTPLVGGAPGAATLGLNRTFWGYTTLALRDELLVPERAGKVLYLHDTAPQAFRQYQLDGTLPAELRGALSIPASSLALYHHEPHMSRVEYQIWEAYGTTTPVALTTFHGVPVVWLYERP